MSGPASAGAVIRSSTTRSSRYPRPRGTEALATLATSQRISTEVIPGSASAAAVSARAAALGIAAPGVPGVDPVADLEHAATHVGPEPAGPDDRPVRGEHPVEELGPVVEGAHALGDEGGLGLDG